MTVLDSMTPDPITPDPIPPAKKPLRSAAAWVAVAGIVTALYFGKLFFITLVIAIFLTNLLEPFVEWFMRLRFPRAVASFLVCSLAVLVIYFAGLGAYIQLSGLTAELPSYSERINQIVASIEERTAKVEKSIEQFIPKRTPEKPPTPAAPVPTRKRRATDPPLPAVQEIRIEQPKESLLSVVYQSASGYYNVVLMASFVPFLVYFMLSWREHTSGAFLLLFAEQTRDAVSASIDGIGRITRAYLLGNFLLGLLLAAVSTAFFLFMQLPYSFLVGPLSGFLSLVPYAGLPLAILPPVLAALPVHEALTPYVVLGATVAFLHLLAMNLLYPKLVGQRVRLNPLAVTISLMFWGLLWDGMGLVLAIPITAGIKAVCDNVAGLETYGKLLGD